MYANLLIDTHVLPLEGGIGDIELPPTEEANWTKMNSSNATWANEQQPTCNGVTRCDLTVAKLGHLKT